MRRFRTNVTVDFPVRPMTRLIRSARTPLSSLTNDLRGIDPGAAARTNTRASKIIAFSRKIKFCLAEVDNFIVAARHADCANFD